MTKLQGGGKMLRTQHGKNSRKINKCKRAGKGKVKQQDFQEVKKNK